MGAIAAKEGKPDDQTIIDALMKQHGNDAILLTHRILDELMIKEYQLQAPSQAS